MISALHFLPVQTAAQLAKLCCIQYLLHISNLHNISAATKDHGSISSWSGHWEEGACAILTGCYLNSVHKGTWVPKLQVALSPRHEVGNGMPKGRVAPGVVPLWPHHFCLVMILLLFTWQPQKGTAKIKYEHDNLSKWIFRSKARYKIRIMHSTKLHRDCAMHLSIFSFPTNQALK